MSNYKQLTEIEISSYNLNQEEISFYNLWNKINLAVDKEEVSMMQIVNYIYAMSID